MKFSLSIDTDTAAFKDNPNCEVSRILYNLALRMSTDGSIPLSSANGVRLLDYHGHIVGHVHVGTPAEDLTIAYVAMGAARAIHEAGGLPEDVCDNYSGECGFIASVIDYAHILDELAEDGRELSGVFSYEVAEQFGFEYARYVIRDEPIDARMLAKRLVDGCTYAPEPRPIFTPYKGARSLLDTSIDDIPANERTAFFESRGDNLAESMTEADQDALYDAWYEFQCAFYHLPGRGVAA